MELILKLLILTILCRDSLGYIIESTEPEDEVLWPTEYYYKAETVNLKTGIVEPYEVWYSENENKSRIDYYGGMVKRYYHIDPEKSSPTVYQINPVTDDNVINKMICKSLEDMDTVDYLPTSVAFTYQGDHPYDDRIVQVWKSEEYDQDSFNIKRILYVHRVGDVDIPVRYEDIRYISWGKVLSVHQITNFYTFNTTVNYEDLDFGNAEECNDFGKIGRNLKVDLELLHPGFPQDVDKAFHSFKKYYNKKHSKREHETRKAIFEDNWRHVVAHNRKNLDYKLAVNKFADQSEEELAYLSGTWPSDPHAMVTEIFPFSEVELKAMELELPLQYDMRIDGVISRIKDQGNCGSCWAFSTIAAVEGALSRNNGGRNIDLSEQYMVDCAWSDNEGCSGGTVHQSFKFISTNGVPTGRAYGPYLGQDGYCKEQNMTELKTIRGFGRVPALSETALKAVLHEYGPVTVSIHSTMNMKLYSSGVFYDAECVKNSANHGVTVVGYGVRDSVNYWIVKNSWGEDWGQDGYILMSSTNDNCNVMTDAYFPIV